MAKTKEISSLTTIGIDRQTNKVIDKLCKRYSLKKGEIVKLAFAYMDKACINPTEAPESSKAELAKLNKRQDDIIRFIRHYEEKELNPMIRATNSIAIRFDEYTNKLTEALKYQTETSSQLQGNLIKAIDTQMKKLVEAINSHSNVINNQIKKRMESDAKLIKLIGLYAELSACGVMESRKKEILKAEIDKILNPRT